MAMLATMMKVQKPPGKLVSQRVNQFVAAQAIQHFGEQCGLANRIMMTRPVVLRGGNAGVVEHPPAELAVGNSASINAADRADRPSLAGCGEPGEDAAQHSQNQHHRRNKGAVTRGKQPAAERARLARQRGRGAGRV